MTLEQAINRFKSFQKLPDKALEFMQQEVPVGPTGNLKDSLGIVETSPGVYTVGVDEKKAPYAYYVQFGRGPVQAKNSPWLYYTDYKGGQKSIHYWGTPGKKWRLHSVARAYPNNFLGRTGNRLRRYIYNELHTNVGNL